MYLCFHMSDFIPCQVKHITTHPSSAFTIYTKYKCIYMYYQKNVACCITCFLLYLRLMNNVLYVKEDLPSSVNNICYQLFLSVLRVPGYRNTLHHIFISFFIFKVQEQDTTFFTTKVLTKLYMYVFNLFFASKFKVKTRWSSQQCC